MKPGARLSLLLLAFLVQAPVLAAEPAKAPAADSKAAPGASREELVAYLARIDKRMTFTSDYKGTVRIMGLSKQNSETAVEIHVYRRDTTRDLLFMTTKPKYMAGSGYLRVGNNLWEYEPTVGQWTRSTMRANISGTFTCEADFERSRLAEAYEPKDEGTEVVDGVTYRKLFLTGKPGTEVSFPLLRLWVDPDLNIVKRIGYAPSGKPLRTDIIRGYQRIKDPLTNEYVYHYKEVLEEEAEEGSRVLVRYDEVVLAPLDPSIFTKSWLESRSR